MTIEKTEKNKRNNIVALKVKAMSSFSSISSLIALSGKWFATLNTKPFTIKKAKQNIAANNRYAINLLIGNSLCEKLNYNENLRIIKLSS